jgi:flagellar biosynthesis anti-sigma factor FlgM
MEIKNIANYLANAVEGAKAPTPRPNGEQKTGAGKETGVPSDRVVLSRDYQDLAQAQKVDMARDDIRTERVDQIRSMIAQGAYVTDPEKTAGRMLDEII